MKRRGFLAGAAAAPVVPAAAAPMVAMHENDVKPIPIDPLDFSAIPDGMMVVDDLESLRALTERPSVVTVRNAGIYQWVPQPETEDDVVVVWWPPRS